MSLSPRPDRAALHRNNSILSPQDAVCDAVYRGQQSASLGLTSCVSIQGLHPSKDAVYEVHNCPLLKKTVWFMGNFLFTSVPLPLK